MADNKEYTSLIGLRYERKFPFQDPSTAGVIRLVKNHPKFFSEIFVGRWINNIYFDTHGMDYFIDNQFGKSDRKKVRIRWYGELFGEITSPILEIKIKHGLAGKKRSYKLPPFQFESGFNTSDFREYWNNANLPEDVLVLMQSLQPKLLNRYYRQYFRDFSKKFRITIDSDMSYRDVMNGINYFRSETIDHNKIVMEIKYDVKDDHMASDYTSYFPYRLDKHSKYVNGIEHFKRIPH